MASIKTKVQAFSDRMKAAVKELKSPANMRKYGMAAADIIRKRTRLGYGASEGSERSALKPLSESYKAYRAGKIAFARSKVRGKSWVYPYKPDQKPKLHPHTSANKSNLTFTGQMLDSLTATKVRQGSATVDVSGTRKDGLTNKTVAQYVAAQGREFNHLTPVEARQLEQMMEIDLKKMVRLK